MDKYVRKDGLLLNKDVGNRGCQRTTRTEAKNTGSTLSNDSYHMKKTQRNHISPHLSKALFNRITIKDLTYYSDGKGTSLELEKYPRREAFGRCFTTRQPILSEGYHHIR